MIEAGLQKLVAQDSAVSALLGSPYGASPAVVRKDSTDGVFPMLAPNQAAPPYIVFSRVTGSNAQSFQGANKTGQARFRFTCYSASYPGAAGLAEAVKKLFATFSGLLTDGSYLWGAIQALETDDAESAPHGTLYGRHLDFELSYTDNS